MKHSPEVKATSSKIIKGLTPQTQNTEGSKFLAVYNSPQLNKLFCEDALQMSYNMEEQKPAPAASEDRLSHIFIYKNEELKLVFHGEPITEGDKRLLDYCTFLLTKQNSNTKKLEHKDTIVRFSIDDYASVLGKDISTKPLRDKLRREIKSGFLRLRLTDIAIVERGSKKGETFYPLGGARSTPGTRGAALEFEFGFQIAEQLIKNHYIALLHPGIFAAKRGLGYSLGRYLCIRYGMDTNVGNGTHDIVSVKALLEAFTGIPTLDELKAGGDFHWQRRIQEKLERELDNLYDLGVLKWEYCGAKKAPLKDEELIFTTYEQFERAYIKFTILDEPDQTERRAKRAATKERRKARQEAAADKYIGQAKAKQQLEAEGAAEALPKPKRGRPRKTTA